MKFDLGHIDEVACVAAEIGENHVVYHAAVLKKKRGEIVILKTKKRIQDVKELVKTIKHKTPVLLHFFGKGILNRQVKKEENYRHAMLLHAQVNDFYFTDYFQDQYVFSSVIRKSVAEEIHTGLAREKLLIIGISSGPFITSVLAPFLDKKDFFVDDYHITTDGSRIFTFEKNTTGQGAVQLGSDRVDRELLGAISLGAAYFNPSESIRLNQEDATYLVTIEAARQRNIFCRFGMGMMLFFLILLSVNYFYLGHLNNKIENNFVTLSEYEDQLSKLSLLEEEQSRKENLLRTSGLLGKTFLSFYLSDIAQSVPDEILLQSLQVRPLKTELKKKQKIEFNEQQVLISGQSPTSDLLSRWIDVLKEKEWLAKVDILDYTYEKNIGNFKIEILLHQ